MKKMICKLLAVVLLAAMLPCAVSAEELTGKTAMEIVSQMGIGWNLGNTFDATGGSDASTPSA